METLSMSKHEIDQISIFENLKERKIKQKVASKFLNLGLRQIQRKLKNYRQSGARGLIHGNRGKPSNRQLNPTLIVKALDLIENHYPDFAPTFASEKLEEICELWGRFSFNLGICKTIFLLLNKFLKLV